MLIHRRLGWHRDSGTADTTTRRRGRIAGLGAVAGAVLAFGFAPVAGAPAAHADAFDDWIFDLVSSIGGDASTLSASDVALDPVGTAVDAMLADLGSGFTADAPWLEPWVDLGNQLVASVHQSYDSLEASFEQLLNQPSGDVISAAATDPADTTGATIFGGAAAVGVTDPDLGGAGGSAAAAAAATEPSTLAAPLQTASVPLEMKAVTEPVVTMSLGGGRDIPVLVDSGSRGLVVSFWDIGWQNIGWPTGFGVGAYSGGLTYFYMTLPTTVDFGQDITTGQDIVTTPTSVDAVLFTWPMSWQAFLAPAQVEGVWGIGANAIGPDAQSIPLVTDRLPGPLSQGMLIDQENGVLQFGPNPFTQDAYTVSGAPNAPLYVSINDGALKAVNAIIDSGGVYGTMPSSVLGTGQTSGSVPAGTHIEVFASDGQTLLYQYTTTSTNTPVVTSGNTMNTGNMPFALQPIYIGTVGNGTTVFGNPGSG